MSRPRTAHRYARTRTVDGVRLERVGVDWRTPDGRWVFWRDEHADAWWLRPAVEDTADPMANVDLVASLAAGIDLLRGRGDL